MLGLAMLALAPRAAFAAPILAGSPGGLCNTVLGAPSPNCGLFSVPDLILSPASLSGEFQVNNDVALFEFVLTSQANLTAFTTGASADGLDPFLALFLPTGRIIRYFDTEQGDDVDAENDDVADGDLNAALPTLLLDPGSYILALLKSGNTLSGDGDGFDSLLEGFSEDGNPEPGACEGCSFTLELSATPPPVTPVIPEPGTLSLVALGSAAAAMMRRRRRDERRS